MRALWILVFPLVFSLLGFVAAPAFAGTAEEINLLPTLDSLNRSEEVLSNSGQWSALAWDSSTSGHNTGRDTTSGWGPYDAFSTVNGAYWNPSTFNDKTSGDAAAVTMSTGPLSSERYVALWLDMPSPGSEKTGYQLRLTVVSGTTYNVTLSKYSAGTQTVLASNSAVSIPNGTTLAISDAGATVTAWQGSSGSLASILSASDTAFTGGYAGIEASGNISHSINFKAGNLSSGGGTPPDTIISSGPKGVVVPNLSFGFISTEGGSNFECALDASAFVFCTSPKAYQGIAEGSHTFKARATGAGGKDETPAERSFQVVQAAKAIAKTALLDNLERSEVPLAPGKWSKSTWAGEIGGAWMSGYRGYGSSFGLAGAYWNPGTFSDGEGTVLVAGTVGTGSVPSGQYSALLLDMPNPGGAHSGYEARFTGTGSATNYTVELAKWVSGTRTVLASTTGFSLPVGTIMALTETAGSSLALWTGTTSLSVVLSASDSTYTSGYAGLEVNGGAGTIYNFRAGRIDIEPPNTTIQSGPSGTVLPGPVSFTFTASESGSSFECSLDGGTYSACPSPKEYTSPAGGSHTFRVRAVDAVGNVDGTPAERSFSIAQPPSTTTAAATSVASSKATLNASVNPNGAATTYQFEYGTTTSYGSKVPATAKLIGSGSEIVQVSEPLTALQPGTIYHFRISATNGAGTKTGEDRSFTTAAAPIATTNAATAISAKEATLKATVNPRGASTTYQFEYGITTSYGSKVPATAKLIGSGSEVLEVSEVVNGLNEGTTYHYRVVAQNEAGTTYGEDRIFESLLLPDVATEAATSVNANEALLEGTIEPNGADAEYKYEYGTTTAYGSNTPVEEEELGQESEEVDADQAVAHLLPETTYHYRLVATSAAGNAVGTDHVLTTAPRSVSAQQEADEAAAELHYAGQNAGILPDDFLGLMWSGENNQTATPSEMNVLGHSGARLFRIYMEQPEEIIEADFSQAANRGVRLLPYFETGWPTESGAQTETANFIRKTIAKYGVGGTFWAPGGGYTGTNPMPPIWWEIGNEPNLGRETSSPTQPYTKARAEEWGQIFTKFAGAAHEGAHGEIKILLSGLLAASGTGCAEEAPHECHMGAIEFLEDMKSSNSYDAVSLHPYVFKVDGHAPRNAADIDTVVRKIRGKISSMHDALPAGKKIWVTELGFPLESNNERSFPHVTPEVQAQLITASFNMIQGAAAKLGVAHLFLFNIRERALPQWEWHCGLRTVAGKLNKEAWHAYLTQTGGNLNWPRPPESQSNGVSIQARSARASAIINPYGLGTMYWVKWGEGPSSNTYGHFTSGQSAGAGESDITGEVSISGLQPERTYHYVVVAENENEEKEESGDVEFKTKAPVTAMIRALNGEPGWVNVSGHVSSETPLNNTWVNINFKKKENGVYVFNENESTHAGLVNGDFSLVNWGIGRGEWQVNVVFEGNSETPRGETGLEGFTVKNAYHLVAQNSGKCLEVSYGSSENGMSVHQEPCGDGHTQQAQAFTLLPSPYNPIQYEVVNRNSGKCLDVSGASQADGAQVVQYACGGWGSPDQIFEGVPVSSSDTSHVKYIAQHSHKCLDITGASTANGAFLEQWTCTGNSNQAFGFESVEADPVPTHTYVTLDETLNGHPGYETLHGTVEAPQAVAGQKAYINFKKKDGSGNYVFTSQAEAVLNSAGQYSVPYWGVGAGDWEVIAIYPGSGNMAESRTVEGTHRFHVGDGYRFKFRHSGRCLSTSGGGTGNGTQIIQWDCSPSPNPADGQIYSIVPMGGGYFQIRPDSNTNMCLDVTGANPANGAYLQLYQCLGAGQANQLWYFTPISGQPPWFAAIAKHSGRCMNVEGSQTGNGARVLQWDCVWTGNEQWEWQSIG